MRIKKSHIFIAVITVLLLNASSVNAITRYFNSLKESATTIEQSQLATSNQYQAQGSDLQDFDLVTEQEGWVLIGQNVNWTSDGGRRWENITPGGLPSGDVRGVTFLDNLNGWFVSGSVNAAGDYDYHVARTFDRGRSWQVNKLSLFSSSDPDSFGDAIYLQFLDQRTGYLVIRRATSTNFRVGTLFKTTDGGLTWSRLSIPIGEPVNFISTSTGWVAGGPSGEELYQTTDGGRSWNRKQINTPIKGNEKLLYRLPEFETENKGLLPVIISDGENSRVEYHVTTNRGNSWKLMESLPAGRGIYRGNDLPLSIFNNQEWMFVLPNSRRTIKSIKKTENHLNNQVIETTAAPESIITPEETETLPPVETLAPAETQEPAESPTVEALQIEPQETPASLATTETPTEEPAVPTAEVTEESAPTALPSPSETSVPSATLAPTITVVPTEILDEETEIVTVQSEHPLSDAIRDLDMVSASTGWAKTMNGNCQSIDPETPTNCTLSVNLLRTEDGGETWQAISLPENTTITLAAYIQNSDMYLGQGFDSCSMPTLSLMQDWIVNSPYRVWNLYIGGSSRAGCGTLTKEYIEALAQQGWKFIITWVGPQAACTTFTTRMSYDKTTAYNQGIAEADMAIQRSYELGLTQPDKTGALIYYDLESYDTNNTTCRAAAKAFMDGWTKRLHDRSNLSGVYGSPCSSAMSDFATNPNVPDTVWLASWLTPYQYRSNVSLTNMSCISNSLWANQQRMRQYTGSHREAWGSSVISSIDSNVIDSPVSVLGKSSSCPQSRGAIIYWNSNYNCANTSGDSGFRQYMDKGFYNISGAFDNQAASIRVPTGWSVMLYEHANRGGGKVCYNSSPSDFTNAGNYPGTNVPINKSVSSLAVFDNTSCSANPAPNPTGGYWSATFYNDANHGTQCAVDTTSGPFLFKDYGAGSPHSKCSNTDNWSAKFTQTVRFPDGKYTFNLGADDRARLMIGSETIIDRWSSTTNSSAVRTLSAGDYLITVEYAELTGSARVAAWWTGPGYIVPRETRDSTQWYAQYWGNTSQWWDSIVRVNEGTDTLNRQWGLSSPGYGLPSDKFSARYERDVILNCGIYNFTLKADDGVRFYINGQLLIDQWKDQVASYVVPISLPAGTHQLRVDHYDNLGGASISLDWNLMTACTPTPTPLPTNTPTFTPTPTFTATTVPTSTPNVQPSPTPVPVTDRIFVDDFESGNLSSWSSSITGAGDLRVASTAALIGKMGMQVNIHNDTRIYVTKSYPTAYKRFRTRFYMHPNSLSMNTGEVLTIYNTFSTNSATSYVLQMRKVSGQFEIQAIADNNNGTSSTKWHLLTNSSQYIEVDWKAASSLLASDGYLRLWINGVDRETISLSNSNYSVNRDRFGAVKGITSGIRGTFYMDAFEARSSTYIGPALIAPGTGTIFADVYSSDWMYPYIQMIYDAKITGGCFSDPFRFCPNAAVSRADMAIFLERGMSMFNPPAASGVFTDVGLNAYYAPWVEQLYKDGITSGCSLSPLRYCPSANVTRDQMAVFLLKAKYGATYQPPPAKHIFIDVPVGSVFEPWIEQLAADGISIGCDTNRFCPTDNVTRGQMAVFLVRTFNIPIQ